ncbi:MAG: hypothetical protein LBJ93_03560 [Clostridiales bacterium]|jgi:hypothetical protein|nr:hypothetical protein [Clostridiales bacterium]
MRGMVYYPTDIDGEALFHFLKNLGAMAAVGILVACLMAFIISRLICCQKNHPKISEQASSSGSCKTNLEL